MYEFETLLVETRGRVRLVTLNRPAALNALNRQVAHEVLAAVRGADADPKIGCIVLTGSQKAFAAGADIKEMQERDFASMNGVDWFAEWDALAGVRKPMIAAVAGYALGGGCELAMMCDLVLAAENAKFGQPEIKLGVMPGMGGSQRLAHRIGKARALELCLTGRMMDATEAERVGLAIRVVPTESLLEEAMRLADTIANMPLQAVLATKDALTRSGDLSLSDGLRYERRLFHALFATEDQKEGMLAFVEKRPPNFVHR